MLMERCWDRGSSCSSSHIREAKTHLHLILHFLPRVPPFLGLLLLEIEVPALAIRLTNLAKLILHELEVVFVVDGAEKVLPDLGCLWGWVCVEQSSA